MPQEGERQNRVQSIAAITLLLAVALYAIGVAIVMTFVVGGSTGVTMEGEPVAIPLTAQEIVVNFLFVVWPIIAIIGLWRHSVPVLWAATSLYTVTSLTLGFSAGYWHLPAVPVFIAATILATHHKKTRVQGDNFIAE